MRSSYGFLKILVEDAACRGEAPQLVLNGGTWGEVGGVARTRRAGQDTGDEGAPPRHLAGAPGLPDRLGRLLHVAISSGR